MTPADNQALDELQEALGALVPMIVRTPGAMQKWANRRLALVRLRRRCADLECRLAAGIKAAQLRKEVAEV